MPFIPHTATDIEEMLTKVGVHSIEGLFDEIPASLRATSFDAPPALNEMALLRLMQARARQDEYDLSFMGAGAYEHHIPAAVGDLLSRGEWMTAYTPYQAEASQGGLQLLYEYQSMIANLMAMEVSNASLYDGASGLAEAALMAVRANRRVKEKRVLLPSNVHPAYRKVLEAILTPQGIEIVELPFCTTAGNIVPEALETFSGQAFTALIIPQPNFFGGLEEVDLLTDWAHAQNALVIGVVNPTAMALIKPPGEWGAQGADIVCGEGQPLGVPLSSGGPYFGFLCCKKALVRQMPGRVVGRTLDKTGEVGYTLTLQAREQHIRRAKATSNICTNQGLMVTAATIYMSLLGPEGLRRVASNSHANTAQLVTRLTAIEGVELVFSRPYFHEAVIRLPKPVETVLGKLGARGLQGGVGLTQHYPELGEALLVCATETKTTDDIARFASELEEGLLQC